MMSLKAFLPQMSNIFGPSPAALYERQRALVRVGILKVTDGRGPGSGVPLSADNLAALILALAVTENLSDTDQRVAQLCEAAPRRGAVCPFTKATSLRGAVAAIVESAALAKNLRSFNVDRGGLTARLQYRSPGKDDLWSYFDQPKNKTIDPSTISTQAIVGARAFQAVEKAMSWALSDGSSGAGSEE